jgi:hypothetical protein
MTFAQKFRLIWIDAVLVQRGQINRADICAAFDISTPQASLDLRDYMRLAGDFIAYDKSAKVYRKSGIESAFPSALHGLIISAQAAVQIARGPLQQKDKNDATG